MMLGILLEILGGLLAILFLITIVGSPIVARKIIFASIGIVICVIVGFVLAYYLWTPVSGRDFRLAGIISGVFICIFSGLLRIRYKWNNNILIASLLPIEIILIIGIMDGSGSHAMNSFNLHWLAGLNLFIGLPWIIGIGIGSGFNRFNA